MGRVTLVIWPPILRTLPCPKTGLQYSRGDVEKKVFWIIFLGLSLLADVFLPFFWGMAATLPIVVLSWWLVYRSGWLC
jgi:uncharacterized membrane protein